jgi:hypothetical protein
LQKPKPITEDEVLRAVKENSYVRRWYEVDRETAVHLNQGDSPPWGGMGGVTQITAAGSRFFIEVYEPK